MLTVCFFAASVLAQDSIPREYTNPEEVISFDRQTPFQDAVEVLNQFSRDFEDRFLIDRTGYTGNIGLTLPPMHWKDALNYILRVQNMTLIQEPDLYEILTNEQVAERAALDETAVDDPTSPEAERIASTRTREVRINATFFEGSRRALREIGVDWSTLTSGVPENLVDFVSEEGTEQFPTQFDSRFVSVNATGAQTVSQNVFNSLINFGEVGAGIEVQALFSAFEADNLGEVLATPSVKVMDGEEGRIQVGEDFSIKQRDFAGNVTDQFFSTGTILTVTPQIIEHEDTTFIYLELEVERSSAQPDPVSTVISKEEASTHSLLIPGESTVIAGLYRTDRSEVRRGIPILKDLPPWFFGLRYLFGYNSSDISQSELIVLIQAELEDSIPERISRSLRSKQEALDEQKIRHREDMDYIPGEGFESGLFEEASLEEETVPVESDPVIPDESEPVQEPEIEQEETPVTDPEPDSEFEPDPIEEEDQTDQTEPVESEEAETVEEVQEWELRAPEFEREDLTRYAGEYTPVEMENMDENHSNLLFYTIGGSFRERANAERLYRNFQEQGYEAHILYQPNSGFYFVAYEGFENLEQAINFTRQIQRDVQSEAWLSTIIMEERLDWNN